MSVGEKLLELVQNTPAVCQAVRSHIITLPGSMVRLDDALEGAPVSFTGGPVTVYGKNLADYQAAKGRISSQPVEILEDGVRWKAGGNYYFIIPVSLPAGVTVRGSYECEANEAQEGIERMRLVYTDGTQASLVGGGGSYSYTVTTTQPVQAIYFYKYTLATALTQDLVIKNIQLELGDQVTDYEPFTQQTAQGAFAAQGVMTVAGAEEVSYFPNTAQEQWVRYNALKAAQQKLREEIQNV